MPTIPRYERVEQAEQYRAQESRLNPRLDQIGQSIGQAGRAVADVAMQEQKRQNEIDTLELRNKMSQWELDNLRDPENGALYTQGKNAFGVSERVMSSYDEFITELKDEGYNERILAELSSQQRRSMAANLSTHEGRARQQYSAATVKATVEQTNTNIAAYPLDEERVQQELAWGEAAILKQGRDTGAPAEATQNAIEQYRSKAQANRVLIMMDDDPVSAQAMMEQLDEEGQLLALDREDLEKRLEEPVKRTLGSEQGETLFMQYGQDPDNQARAMDELNAIEDESERRYAKARYREMAQAEKVRQEESYSRDLGSAWDTVMGPQNGPGGHYRDIPPTVWGRLEPSDRRALISYSQAEESGKGTETDWNLYTNLSEVYASDPNQFLKISPSSYINKLDKAERKQVLGWRRDAMEEKSGRGSSEKTIEQRSWIDTKNRIVTSALGGINVETGSKASPEDAAKSNAFRAAVQRRYESWLGQNPDKKEMPEGEFRKMVGQLATEVSLPGTGIGGFFQDTARAYELPAGSEAVVDVDDVPEVDRRQIEDSLTRHGLPVTDDLIVRYYLQGSGLRVNPDE